jgi:hypothetical protein
MMDIVHFVPDGEYERYEELTLMKDRYEKDAGLYQRAYIREFGELITESFKLKIDCIALKKEIAIYVKAKNTGETVTAEDVKKILEQQMSGYYNELDIMIKDNNESKAGRPVSNYEAEQIKKLYRKLAKLLHPDISPLTLDYPVLADYFTGFEAVIPDAAERIEELERDIDLIIHSEPYTYRLLLEDEAAVAAKKEELTAEIKEYEAYKKELTAKLDEIRFGDQNGGQ